MATHFIMKRAESLPTSKQVELEEQSRCREVTYYVSLDRLTIREVMLHCNVYVIHSPTMPTGQYSMYPNYSTYITLSLSLLESLSYDVCLFTLAWSTPCPKCRLRAGLSCLMHKDYLFLVYTLVTRVSTNVCTTCGDGFKRGGVNLA